MKYEKKFSATMQVSIIFQSHSETHTIWYSTNYYRSIGLNVIVKYKYIDEQRQSGKIHTYQKKCLFIPSVKG